MTSQEAIDARKSRRTYTGEAIPEEAAAKLEKLIVEYNEADGLSMSLVKDGKSVFGKFGKGYGMFTGVRSLIVLAGNADDPDLEVKLGYRGEYLALGATALGLGTCWVSGTFDRSDPLVKADSGIRVVGVLVVGPVPAETTRKERVIRALAHRGTKPLEYFFECEGEPPAWFLDGVRAVSKAPSAINRQPVKIRLDAGRPVACLAKKGEGVLVDLGIALAHFEIATGKLPARE